MTLLSLLESREQHYIKAINQPVMSQSKHTASYNSISIIGFRTMSSTEYTSANRVPNQLLKNKQTHPPNNTVWNTISALSNTTNHATVHHNDLAHLITLSLCIFNNKIIIIPKLTALFFFFLLCGPHYYAVKLFMPQEIYNIYLFHHQAVKTSFSLPTIMCRINFFIYF